MNKTVGTAPFKLGLVELRFYDLPGAGPDYHSQVAVENH